jgi:hypothetical protein
LLGNVFLKRITVITNTRITVGELLEAVFSSTSDSAMCVVSIVYKCPYLDTVQVRVHLCTTNAAPTY